VNERAVHAFVRGRVQGVAFRYHTLKRAEELGVRGWVRNLPDGRVEVRAQGAPSVLEAFVGWLARGPAWARVDEVDARDAEPEQRSSFEIR